MSLDFYNHWNYSQSGSRAWERRRPGGEWIGKYFAAKRAGETPALPGQFGFQTSAFSTSAKRRWFCNCQIFLHSAAGSCKVGA